MIKFPDDVDSDEFLEVLQQALDAAVVKRHSMSRAEYTAIFTAIYRCQCCAQPKPTKMAPDAKSTSIQLSSHRDRRLYDWIIDYIIQVTSEIGARMMQLSGEELLTSYIDEWEHFQLIHMLVGRLFHSVDQNWIESKRLYSPSYTTVSNTLIQLWYVYLFQHISIHLMANAIQLVRQERDGGIIDGLLIVKLYKALVELAPKDMDGLRVPFREDLGVYIRHYEIPYIVAAIAYIDQRVCSLRKSTRMREYIGVLSELLAQEEQRSEVYLRPESLNPAKNALNLQFLVREVDQICEMAGAMLEAGDDRDGLRIIYSLLKRFDGSDTLQTLQRKFISSAESDILQGCPQRPTSADSRNSDFTLTAVDYFDSKLDTYKATIHELFQGDSNYIAALEKAFAQVINSSAAKSKLTTRPSRLAAEYCNLVLAKNKLQLTGPGDDTKQAVAYLCKAMQIVHAYKSKDEFFNYYRRLLARRLLNNTSYSMDLEKAAISVIYETMMRSSNLAVYKKIADHSQTLEGTASTKSTEAQEMVGEIVISEEYSHEFVRQHPELTFSMSVKTLSAIQWSDIVKSHDTSFALPRVLNEACDLYRQFYKLKHAKQTIKWQREFCKVTVQLYFPDSTSRFAESGYTFVLNVYQFAILELFTGSSAFNEDAALTHSQIRLATSMSIDRVEQELGVMVKAGLFERTANNTKVQINNKYRSKHPRVDISQAKISHRKKEEEENENIILAYRTHLLQADIARVMKEFKFMTDSKLFMEVSLRRSNFFSVEKPTFKNAVEKVIDRGLIERGEDANTYLYCS
ncbi:ubiquitin ligase (cullin) of SCF [Coemansia sp. RSA 2708]|nr:ubiquitin ligase (cullin) of SCF [Coemansia sp. RSA 2708]